MILLFIASIIKIKDRWLERMRVWLVNVLILCVNDNYMPNRKYTKGTSF